MGKSSSELGTDTELWLAGHLSKQSPHISMSSVCSFSSLAINPGQTFSMERGDGLWAPRVFSKSRSHSATLYTSITCLTLCEESQQVSVSGALRCVNLRQ